jgi:hypothetical protein
MIAVLLQAYYSIYVQLYQYKEHSKTLQLRQRKLFLLNYDVKVYMFRPTLYFCDYNFTLISHKLDQVCNCTFAFRYEVIAADSFLPDSSHSFS